MVISKTNIKPIKYFKDGVEIIEAEYQEIMNIIRNKPIAPEGFDYRLTNELTWELFEIEYIEDETETE